MRAKKNQMKIEYIIAAILIAVFFVIALYWFIFIFNQQEAKEILKCHTSIVMRDAVNIKGTGIGLEMIPLKCKTKYICFTKDKGASKCPRYYKKIKVKSKEDIMKVLAEEQAKWWAMTDEGKRDYNPPTAKTNVYCMIGSFFRFDDTIEADNNLNKISYEEYHKYLERNSPPLKDKSYLEYLYNTKKADDSLKLLNENLEELRKKQYPYLNIRKMFMIEVKKERDYILYTGIIKHGPWSFGSLIKGSVIMRMAFGLKNYYVLTPTINPISDDLNQVCHDFDNLA